MRHTIVLFFMLVFLAPFEVDAHTYLSSSVPGEGTVVKNPLQDVTLSFLTGIDAISTMTLVTDNGDTIPFKELNVMKRELKGTLTQPLENGTYTIEWKIVGEDGHPISGKVPFEVQLTEIMENTEPIEKEKENVDRQESNNAAPLQKDQTSSNSSGSVHNSSNLVITLLLSGLGVMAILSLGYLLRKKV